MKLGIVDLDTGNLASLLSALNKLNINFKICKNSFDFEDVDKIILPGVGAFKDLMKKIKEKNMDKTIVAKIGENVPILGVCVGFQILFSGSNEHGDCSGLNLIKGNFINFKDENNLLKEMLKKIPSGFDNVLKNRIRWMIYKLKVKKNYKSPQ